MDPIWTPYGKGGTKQGAMIPTYPFFKGQGEGSRFFGRRKTRPPPPRSATLTCYNVSNAESVFHAAAQILGVFHGVVV